MKKTGLQRAVNTYRLLLDNIQQVIQGKDTTIKMLLAAFFCGGHVLLEDAPGTGKTILAKSLAASIGTDFKRVQFTPDLLPADILGVSIYNHQQNSFSFHRGPVFTNILLADEINRASPRTQSALLEAMGEKQVSIEGRRFDLSDLFFVIATENPVESHGTYPLPESQMDRFMVKLSPGYLRRDEEVAVISDQISGHPLDVLEKVAGEEEIFEVMEALPAVRISEELRYFIVDLVSATRHLEHVAMGASVRASLGLMKISQALALFDGREFVIPEDILEAIEPVLGHRLQIQPQARFSGISPGSVLREIIGRTEIPG